MGQTQVPDDPLSRFSLSVFAANGLLMQSGEIVTRQVGQSSARWQVLGRAGHQAQTVSEMARDIGNTRQGVQRIANALAKEGLVAFKSNPADNRAQLVGITPKGAEVLSELYRLDQLWSQKLMHKLDPEELVHLADSLDAVNRILADHLSEERRAVT